MNWKIADWDDVLLAIEQATRAGRKVTVSPQWLRDVLWEAFAPKNSFSCTVEEEKLRYREWNAANERGPKT